MGLLRTIFFSLSLFFSFPSTLVIDSRVGGRGLAKAWASVPRRAKDESKEGSEHGIVPTLQCEESRSWKKVQV